MTQQAPAFCGFLNVLKPPGMTSARVVSVARHLFDGEKVGHAGTLDPEAAGVLPLMIGKAARLFDYMQDKEKAYVAEVAFGCSTDTQDAQGVAVERGDHYPDEAAIRAMLPRFTGELMQRPPMFSALKQDGRRLYDLARSGQTVDVPERPVTVHSLALTGVTERHGAMLDVRCSKGFYVRTLCHDLGQALGCPSHMRFLLRTQSGVFTLRTARTLEELQAAKDAGQLHSLLPPPESALLHLPCAEVPDKLEKLFRNGVPLHWSCFPALHGTSAEHGAPFRLNWHGALTAIGERKDDTIKLRTWLGD